MKISTATIKSAMEIPCNKHGNFFYCWLLFLNPLWKASPSMIKVASEILRHRFELQSKINDDDLLDKTVITDKDIREDIMKACNMSYGSYNVALGNLRKSNFFLGRYEINKKFIPKIDDIDNATDYNLLITFTFDEPESNNI